MSRPLALSSVRALLLAALLSGSALAASDPLLAGTTNGLHWAIYGPGALVHTPLTLRSGGPLQLSLPAGATLLGAKYRADQEAGVLAYRSRLPLRALFEFHDAQLTEQGFRRESRQIGARVARASYERGTDTVDLRLETRSHHRVRIRLLFGGTRAVNPRPGDGPGGLYDPTDYNAAGPNDDRVVPKRPYGPPLSVYYNGGLRYQFYGGQRLGTVERNENAVKLDLPGRAHGTREPYLTGNAVLIPMNTALSTRQIFDHYARLLTKQGFEQRANTLRADGDTRRAVYARGVYDVVGLIVHPSPQGGANAVAVIDFTP